MSKFRLILIVLCSFTIFSYGQSKNERESKISKIDFPIAAQQTISMIPDKAKRIKYYQETDGDKLSFECKFKLQNLWYSVEFNEDGILEDIEVRVRKHQLPKQTKDQIDKYLNNNCDKFDIVKIQEQYVQEGLSPDMTFLKSTISNRKSTDSNFELIVAIKNNKEWTLKEMTFDKQGVFLNSRALQTDSYEYIMY